MELQKLEESVEDLIDVPVLFDDDGESTDGFKVVGLNSSEYINAERAWRLQNIKRAARRGRPLDTTNDRGADELLELTNKRETVLVKACVKQIYGFTENGKALELSNEVLDRLFALRPNWRTKILQAIESENVFTTP